MTPSRSTVTWPSPRCRRGTRATACCFPPACTKASGYAIAEAAAVGCDLAVLDHLGADEFWPAQTRFGSNRRGRCADPACRAASLAWTLAAQYPCRSNWRRSTHCLNGEPSVSTDATGARERLQLRRLLGKPLPPGRQFGRRLIRSPAHFKAEIVNAFVREHAITSVIDSAAADGAQLALAEYPSYVGVDVSPTAVGLCRQRFVTVRTAPSNSHLAGKLRTNSAPLNSRCRSTWCSISSRMRLSDAYMRDLFGHARRFVIIYACDKDEATQDAHVRHRKFTDWIARNADGWQRIAPHRQPLQVRPVATGGHVLLRLSHLRPHRCNGAANVERVVPPSNGAGRG